MKQACTQDDQVFVANFIDLVKKASTALPSLALIKKVVIGAMFCMRWERAITKLMFHNFVTIRDICRRFNIMQQ